MKKIGLTGGIGSGKSYVAKVIEAMGHPVYYSDIRAKHLSNEHPLIRENLSLLFGKDTYLEGKLNTQLLTEKIYSDASLREKVNEIIHPIVREDFTRWASSNDSRPLIFNEAAILFETGAYKQFDRNILVQAPHSLKIDRIKTRDGISMDEVQVKMKAQWSDQEKEKLADYKIQNDEQSPLLVQIENIVEDLINRPA